MGITFVMAAVIAATPAGACSWAHPGANPFRGDPQSALADFAIPDETRRQLRVLMAAHRYTDIATITRGGIVGRQRYEDLREMHSGHGQTCHGAVDRSAWSDQLQERGLVYCAGDTCVIVPTICNNVSLVTRKPDEHAEAATEDEGPIDISPAAGPPAPIAALPAAEDTDASTPDFLAAPESGGAVADLPYGGGGAAATGCTAGCFAGGGGGEGGGGPVGSGPWGSPVPPAGPVEGPPPMSLPPVSSVPEAPTSLLMFLGLAALTMYRRAAAGRPGSTGQNANQPNR